MKKRRIMLIISVFLLVVVFYYINLPKYTVHSSTSFSNGSNRDTKLNVIVYNYCEIDELIENIKEEHIMINGMPTMLEIRLYKSKWYLYEENPFKTIVFDWTNCAVN